MQGQFLVSFCSRLHEIDHSKFWVFKKEVNFYDRLQLFLQLKGFLFIFYLTHEPINESYK